MLRILARIALTLLLAGCGHDRPRAADSEVLEGVAEDLWGSTIDLGRLDRGLVLLHPFSPSNCGYCLFEGPFVRENYLRPTAATGGRVFHQCLFNPQRDVYTFLKHERDTETPVLTFPPALHRYHRDGFPFLAAFRAGRALYRGSISPYEERWRTLAPQLWPAGDSTLVPTSPLHMATRFVFENEQALAVVVVPDGDEPRRSEWLACAAKWRGNPADVKFERDLTPLDLEKNLYFAGALAAFRFDALAGRELPFQLAGDAVTFGDQRFVRTEVQLTACFPNPYNLQRYVVLAGGVEHNDVDFTLSRRDPSTGTTTILLEGFFRKEPGRSWQYSDSLTHGSLARGERCPPGSCPAPVATGFGESPAGIAPASESHWESVDAGSLRRFGGGESRFPSLAVTPSGACWVAWEERGDILAARADAAGAFPALIAAGGGSDSFDPVLAAAGERVWVVFLDDRERFYRVYARAIDGGALTEAVPVSPAGPYDVVTPAAVADSQGVLIVAWSEWRANQRYLRYRRLRAGVLDSVRTTALCPSEIEYANAWYPALAVDARNQVWGAWNQHYPATLCVCIGNLGEPARPVTRVRDPGGPESDDEHGGYPSLVCDREGRRWVFWEGFAWDGLAGEPQRIRAACFDSATGSWSRSENLARPAESFFNQTPKTAIDPHGDLWVAWSGRDREGRRPWGVYLTHGSRGDWSLPERVSPPGTDARAPAVVIGSDGQVWIAWHAGRGADMRIEVLKYRSHSGGGA